MTTYYIDPSASVNGDGLATTTPFNTWVSVTWGANNEYLQRAGTIWSGAKISPTADNVTVGAYGITASTPRALFNGVNIASNTRAFEFLAGSTNVTLQDFEIYNVNGTIVGSSASTPKSTGAKVLRCKIHDSVTFIANGISIYGTNTLIQDSEVYNTDDGVWLSDDGSPTIDHCNIHDVGIDPLTFTGDCIQLNTHVGTATVKRCTLSSLRDKQCVLGGNGGGPLHVYDTTMISGSWGVNTNLCVGAVEIKRCTFLGHVNEEGVGTSYAGILHGIGTTDMLVESCLFNCNGINANGIYCTDPTSASATITVIGCTFEDNAIISGQPTGLISLFRNGWTLVAKNCSFKTDLQFAINGTAAYGSSITTANATITLTNNQFETEYFRMFSMNGTFYSTVAAMQAAALGSGNIVGNRLVSASSRPMVGSSLLSAGTFISYAARDCDGRQRPNPPSIGAYDYATTRIVP